jgi:hypothetical protein
MLEKRAFKRLKNLPKRMVTELRRHSEVEIDVLMNTALKCMNIITRSRKSTDEMVVEAWEIYSALQSACGKVHQKFMGNTENNPRRVQSMSAIKAIKGQDWSKFYNPGEKPFDQYYRHGGRWRYGSIIWKSQRKT